MYLKNVNSIDDDEWTGLILSRLDQQTISGEVYISFK